MDKVIVTVGFPLDVEEIQKFVEERWNLTIDRVVNMRKHTKDTVMYAIDNDDEPNDFFKLQAKLNKQLENEIREPGNVLVFGQNHTPQTRKCITDAIRKCGKETYFVVDCPDVDGLKSSYPASVEYIASTVRHFTIPLPTEFTELAFFPREPITDINNLIDMASAYHVKSNHHDETIAHHGMQVSEIMEEKGYSDPIIVASYLHDVGKVDTMSMEKNGTYHYYGHPNVSAYRLVGAMSYLTQSDGDEKEIYKSIAMVNHHMAPYDWEMEGQKLYNKRLYGEELYQILIDMNVADRACSKRED